MRSQSYTYDKLSNPQSRGDASTNLSERFTYDELNRPTLATVNLSPGPLVKSFSYSTIGNVLSKSDVGNYSYAPPGSPTIPIETVWRTMNSKSGLCCGYQATAISLGFFAGGSRSAILAARPELRRARK